MYNYATAPLWWDTARLPQFTPLARDLDVDVAVIGGGVTGVTAAFLLARAGRRVAVLERDRVGAGETGRTTAHITQVFDTRFTKIRDRFGMESARLAARAHREAVDLIDSLADGGGLAADFTRVSAYLYTEHAGERDSLAEEAEVARELGVPCSLTAAVPLPFKVAAALRFDDQGRLHPLRYLRSLVGLARAQGAEFFHDTPALDISDGEPCVIATPRGMVRARDVVVATNVPVNNRVLVHTKLAAYRSYAIAAALDTPPPDGLFWDTADPYHYIRMQPSDHGPLVIVGGCDHRTGTPGADDAFEALERFTAKRFGRLRGIRHRWSGQIIEPVDGLPYIGRNALESHISIATGYSGTGVSLGTLAAQIISDSVLGRQNPYRDIFDATRFSVTGAGTFIVENAAFPLTVLKDRVAGGDRQSLVDIDSLEPGDGIVVSAAGQAIAVSRNPNGALHAVKAVCTHLGCDVRWNRAEQSWDCPCHGSRFSACGRVLNGPAVTALEPVAANAGGARPMQVIP